VINTLRITVGKFYSCGSSLPSSHFLVLDSDLAMTLKPFSLFLLSPFQSPYENLELKKPCSLILLIKKEEENFSVSSFLRVNGKGDNKNKESRQIIGWRDDNDDCRYVVAPFFLLPAAMLPGGVFPTSFVAFSSLVYNDSSRRNTSRVCV